PGEGDDHRGEADQGFRFEGLASFRPGRGGPDPEGLGTPAGADRFNDRATFASGGGPLRTGRGPPCRAGLASPLLSPDRVMPFFLNAARRPLMFRSLREVARRRPRMTALVLGLLLLAAAGAGFYAYALRQWHLAQADLKQNRAEEARR